MTLIGTSFSMVSAQVFHWSTRILMLLTSPLPQPQTVSPHSSPKQNTGLKPKLFATCGNGRRPSPLTAAAFRRKLRTITQACPLLPHCSAHSLRKGGATWLLQARVPLATVRIIGDWASDAVYHYLLPDTDAKFEVVSQAINTALPLNNS